MPAVTFMHRTIHSSQNCGVRSAPVAPKLFDVIIALPLTVSGLGVREGMFVHAFGAWGVAEPVALAGASA